jgi:hypothetical protein
MKQIKFDGKLYNIPESWQDVTVGMLIKSAELSELLEDAPIIAIISAYTGIPVKDLRLQQRDAVLEITSIMAFLSEPYVPIAKTSFQFNGETYACEDDLNNQNFEDFVSIQTATYNHRDEPYRALPKLIAIYCKKSRETLNDFNLTERSKLMEAIPMTDAKDIEAFFLSSLIAAKSIGWLSSTQDVQKSILLHKIQELRNTMKKSKERIGMFSPTRLQIGLFRIYLWLWQKDVVKYFNSPLTKSSKKTFKQTLKNLLSKKPKRKSNV